MEEASISASSAAAAKPTPVDGGSGDAVLSGVVVDEVITDGEESPEQHRLLAGSQQLKSVVLQPYHGHRILQTPEVPEDTLCGLGPFHPTWMQRLASKKSYVVLHGLIGLNTFALSSYFTATISTIEKRFKIPSRTSGLIASAWDIGAVFSMLLLTYLGSRGHRTRFVACGAFVVGLTCFIRLLPHLIYGAGQDALELTVEYGASISNLPNSSSDSADGVSTCGNIATDTEDCSVGSFSTSITPSIIFFVAHLVIGIGHSMYYSLGMAYLDDNTRKNKAPVMLAITQCLRLLGPTVGFATASYTLSRYVDPDLHPAIDNNDPRWIGAWWIGWAPYGAVTFALGGLMLLFPRQLPRTAQRKAEQDQPTAKLQKSLKDFQMAFCRILRNKVLILNTLSGVCFMFGYIGYWTFMPKYMETQYRQSASKASLISGSVGLIFTALGIMTSALVIYKFKPRPRTLAAWNVVVEIIDVIGHFSWAFLSCPDENLHGVWADDNSWNLTDSCNSGCDCGPTVKYAPICSLDGNVTFYSPCHGGCTSWDLVNGTKMYGNCSCLAGGGAMDGPCPMDCSTNFTIFIITQCILHFLQSSGKAGNTLVQFRCVDEEDKALSIGFSDCTLSALALVPGPVVYGMLLDSACLVWGQTCGQSGNCWLYDGQSLRFLLNFTAAGCLMLGMLLDVGVWYYAKDLKIYDEDDTKEDGVKKPGTLDNILENI